MLWRKCEWVLHRNLSCCCSDRCDTDILSLLSNVPKTFAFLATSAKHLGRRKDLSNLTRNKSLFSSLSRDRTIHNAGIELSILFVHKAMTNTHQILVPLEDDAHHRQKTLEPPLQRLSDPHVNSINIHMFSDAPTAFADIPC